jgi:adenylosuccinate lyase
MVLSEWLLFRIGNAIGKMQAQETMRDLTHQARTNGTSLKECALADRRIAALLDDDDLAFLDHPEKYIGLAENLINDLLRDIAGQQANDPEGL